VVLENLYYR